MIWRTFVRYVSLGHTRLLRSGCNRSCERRSQQGIAPLSRQAGISPGSVSFVTCFTPLSNHAVNSQRHLQSRSTTSSGLQPGVIDICVGYHHDRLSIPESCRTFVHATILPVRFNNCSTSTGKSIASSMTVTPYSGASNPSYPRSSRTGRLTAPNAALALAG